MTCRRAWLVLVVGLLTACGKSEPTSTQAAPAPPSAAASAAPEVAGPELPPLAVGQWIRHSVRREDGTASEISYKVVGKEGDAFWIEIESGAPGSGTVIGLLITLKNRKDPSSSDILAARMKLPGREMREVRGDSLNATKKAYQKSMAQIFVPGLAGMPREDVTVPAGTFKGCYRRTETTDVGDVHSETTLWTHPSVPITGLVRSKSKDGTGMELIAFGMTGAKSSL